MRNTGNMVHGGERVGLKIAGEFRPTDFPPNLGSLTKPSQAALPCPYLGIPWCPRPQAPATTVTVWEPSTRCTPLAPTSPTSQHSTLYSRVC